MGRKKRVEFENACYHVTHRGNLRDDIFFDRQDRVKFLDFLKDSVKRYKVILHAFVMMDNHYHFLIQTPHANLGNFMQQFNVRYTSWINWKYNRSGHLFQGPFKASLVDEDNYLSAVSRYVHLNPVKVKVREDWPMSQKRQFLKTYEWSSLPGYLDPVHAYSFVTHDLVLSDSQGNRRRYFDSVTHQLTGKDQTELFSSFMGIAGGIDFIKKIASRHMNQEVNLLKIHPLPVSVVENTVSQAVGIPIVELRRMKGKMRYLLIVFLLKYAELSAAEIARHLKLSQSSVSVAESRLNRAMEIHNDMKKDYEKIDETLKRTLEDT